MKKNIGLQDRIFRFIIGMLLLAFAFWQTSWVALAFALFTFFEAFASWCVIYQLMGKSTCPGLAIKFSKERDKSEVDSRRLGLAGGILFGLSMFISTILSLYTGYGSQFLEFIGMIYPGYTISWEGSLIGLVYGFIGAATGLSLLGWLYNKL